MVSDQPPWSSRSILVSVRDLDRSVAFYQSVMGLNEVLRDEQIAACTGDETWPFTLYLRQALRNASHPGGDTLGVRSLSWDVGSIAELDRVEERLRAAGAFRDRRGVPGHDRFEVVRGQDPDRLSLTFVANETNAAMSSDDYLFVLALMYSIDL